jgi:RNA polymerase sigma-70 factor (ECF subfamily)
MEPSSTPDWDVMYEELRRLARIYLRRHDRRDHSLPSAAIVNECFLRLLSVEQRDWENKAHFFNAATRTMRRVLVDHARARSRIKRGGDIQKIPLDDVLPASGKALDKGLVFSSEQDAHVIAVDDALAHLAQLNPRQAKIVELRFFSDLADRDIAKIVGISERQLSRDMKVALAWLRRELANGFNGTRSLADGERTAR